MKRGLLPRALLLLCILSAAARADLEADLAKILRDPYFQHAEIGLVVVRLGASADKDAIVYRHNSDIPLTPASNMKLATTSAFLDKMGPDFKFHTALVQRGQDLILVGDADPTFGDAEMLRKVGWDVTTVFQSWAQELKKHNVTTVRDVLVDDSILDQTFFHPNWPARQENARYEAQVAGMSLNAGCVDFMLQVREQGALANYTTNPPTKYVKVRNTCVQGENRIELTRTPGANDIALRGQCSVSTVKPLSITVHDPAMFAATVLAETLSANGIKVEGKIDRDRTVRAKINDEQAGLTVVAVHETTIGQVIARTNKDSMNCYAETLCKRLGHTATGESGTWQNGTPVVGAFLKKLGTDEHEFTLDDGSGLSKEDTISPNALCRVLSYNYHGKNRELFMGCLSVAGQDGTLEDRFPNSDLRGRVLAKSGFIEGVSGLSGYFKAKDGQWYAFTILFNGIPAGTNQRAKQMQELIVKTVDAAVATPATAGSH